MNASRSRGLHLIGGSPLLIPDSHEVVRMPRLPRSAGYLSTASLTDRDPLTTVHSWRTRSESLAGVWPVATCPRTVDDNTKRPGLSARPLAMLAKYRESSTYVSNVSLEDLHGCRRLCRTRMATWRTSSKALRLNRSGMDSLDAPTCPAAWKRRRISTLTVRRLKGGGHKRGVILFHPGPGHHEETSVSQEEILMDQDSKAPCKGCTT